MSFVAEDLGASSTRYTTTGGRVDIIRNNMVFLPVDEKIDLEPDDVTIESALEVKIVKEGESKFFPIKALIGSMAERHSSINEKPLTTAHKHKQPITYVSGIVAAAIAKLRYNLDEDIELYLALPPLEVKSAKDKVIEEFRGNYTVYFPKYNGGTQVKLNIVDVHVFEESVMSLMSYFFNRDCTVNENAKKYLSGYVLSLDIGASTTDVALVKDGKYQEKTGKTYKTGGNIARDMLIEAISRDYGFDLNPTEAEKVMAEGRLQLGDAYEEIPEIVTEVKTNFAKSIVNQMDSYFKQIGIPIQSTRAIVTSGGGSMQSQYVAEDNSIKKTSESVSLYITESLKTICPTVAVVNHGNTPRLANIKGLFIKAKTDELRAMKANGMAREK